MTSSATMMCGCGHLESRHGESGCYAWVFGVPTAASAGRCSCSQFIGDGVIPGDTELVAGLFHKLANSATNGTQQFPEQSEGNPR